MINNRVSTKSTLHSQQRNIQQSNQQIRYSKTCLKRPLKNRQNKAFNGIWQLNECRKYCRMLPLEHSAILLTCIKRYSVLKTIFVFSLGGRLRPVLLYFESHFEHVHDINSTILCAPNKASDQLGHPPRPIRGFAERIRKAWILRSPSSKTVNNLI